MNFCDGCNGDFECCCPVCGCGKWREPKRKNRKLRFLPVLLIMLALWVLAAPAALASDGGLVTTSDSVLANLMAVVAIGTPITLGLVELIKKQGLPTRLAPAIALIAGLVVSALLVLADVATLTAGQAALTGLLTGISAAGTYSGVKAIRGG